MAEPLKYMYNPQFFEKLCPYLKASIPGFDCNRFIFLVFDNSWPDLELKGRVRHIAKSLRLFLPEDFRIASRFLVSLSAKLRAGGFREQSFQLIFLAEYIQLYGLDHPGESLNAIEEITKLVSCEFAVRPFITKYPDETMSRMFEWSRHENANVRRLASEGCRPRLPWAPSLTSLDPGLIISILENLKEDPSEYVQKSVANNLNDIAKDHPEEILSLVEKWQGKNEITDWILKRGCRSLLKNGNDKALIAHGFNPRAKAKVSKLLLSKERVRIGEHLEFNFQVKNCERKSSVFRLEYAIDFQTSSGRPSRKIFKISESHLDAGSVKTVSRRQSFKDLTTRKHYKGAHQLTILANGQKLAAAEFMLC